MTMDAMPEAAHLLRAYGLRATPQRVLLLHLIQTATGHFTAEDMYKRVVETYPALSLVSVYRTLETLCRLGLVTHTELGDARSVYEWALGDRHHHLICTRCGYREQLEDAELDPLRMALQARHGFHALINHYAIFGLCAHCAAQEPGAPVPSAP
jgi:Fur family ferric uptake transcriptional regulator